MADANPLKAALLQLAAGTATDAEREVVQQALQNNQITLAAGEQSVAIGGNVDDTVIVTGNGNIVFKGVDAKTLYTVIHRMSISRPRDYIGHRRNPLFQARPGEFETLETLFFGRKTADKPVCVGLVGVIGMGGIGKTQLAVELAYRYQEQQRFPGGIFGMPATGTDFSAWQREFANLAAITDYLPFDEDESSSEKEARRARYLCHYLAEHTDALLILDNVEVPDLVTSIFPRLVGKEAKCSILYTSRLTSEPEAVTIYSVEYLSEDAAIHLLLKDTRPSLLSQIKLGHQNDEIDAVRGVCKHVGYLPLALIHLRSSLKQDRRLTLKRLYEKLTQRETDTLHDVLFETFNTSWQWVQSKEEQHIFQLVTLFPEAIPIPLWLLGLASGLDASEEIIEAFGKALFHLQEVSLIEDLSENQIQVHPLVRQFGRRLLTEDSEPARIVLREAEERLLAEFTNVEKLEKLARKTSYWVCLERVQQACDYLEQMKQIYEKDVLDHEKQYFPLLQTIYQLLDHESSILGNDHQWQKKIPGLFYQQLFNQAVENKMDISIGTTDHLWIKQHNSTGVTSPFLLKLFTLPSIAWSIAYSPDGSKLLGASEFKGITDIFLWHAKTGQILYHYSYTNSRDPVLTFFPNSQQFLSCLSGFNAWHITVWNSSSFKGSTYRLAAPKRTEHNWLYPQPMIAISPDGNIIAIGRGRNILLWNLVKEKFLFMLGNFGMWDNSVFLTIIFSQGGDKICAISKKEAIYVWDIHTKRMLWFRSNIEAIGVTFLSNQELLVGTRNGVIWHYDIFARRLSQFCTLHIQEKNYELIAFSQDGKRVAASKDRGEVELWNIKKKEYVYSVFHDDTVINMVFAHDGKTIFTASMDTSVRLWSVRVEDVPYEVLNYWGENASLVGFSPATKNILFVKDSQTIVMRDIQTGKQILCLKNPENIEPKCVTISPEETIIVAGSESGLVYLWDARTEKLLFSLLVSQTALRVAQFMPDGRYVLLGSKDGLVYIFDIESKDVKILQKGYQGSIQDIHFVSGESIVWIFAAISARGCRFQRASRRLNAPYSLKELWAWDEDFLVKNLNANREMGFFIADNCVFSSDGKKGLVSIYRMNGYYSYICETSINPPITNLNAFANDYYTSATFSPSGSVCVLGLLNGMVVFRRSSDGEELHSLEIYEKRMSKSAITAVSFSPDSHILVVCNKDGYISFWRMNDEEGKGSELIGKYFMKEYPREPIKVRICWHNSVHLTILDESFRNVIAYYLEIMNL